MSRKKLYQIPLLILGECFEIEHKSNWMNANTLINYWNLPLCASVVQSHVVYKIKEDEEVNNTLRVRIVPHGNEDDNKDEVRKDSSNAQLSIIRLVLALSTVLNFTV